MTTLTDLALTRILDRCALANHPLSHKQRVAVKGILDELLNMTTGPRPDADIVYLYRIGELSEGTASYWLQVDRLRLREMAREQEVTE